MLGSLHDVAKIRSARVSKRDIVFENLNNSFHIIFSSTKQQHFHINFKLDREKCDIILQSFGKQHETYN